MRFRDLGTTRSSFLASGIAAFGGIAAGAVPAKAAEFSYRVGNPDVVGFPVTIALVQLADAMREETKGRFDLQVFPNSQLGSTTSMLGQLRLGSMQFVAMNHALFATVVPVAQINSLGFAFTSSDQALKAFDGPLGGYIRKEFASKGLYCLPKTLETGFKQLSTNTHPLKAVDDFGGVRIRSIPAQIVVDLFKTLGASPVPLDSNEIYSGLQTHVIDGIDDSLASIDGHKLYEVLKYITISNHAWSGYWLVANATAWGALPPDIQAAFERNAAKYTLAERRSIHLMNASIADKLGRHGIAYSKPDLDAIRAKLSPYYARWKNELGPTAWGLLEASVGKLT